MPSDISTVRRERQGRVLVVRIDREAKRNAIARAVERVKASDDISEGVTAFFEKRAALDGPLTGGVSGVCGAEAGSVRTKRI